MSRAPVLRAAREEKKQSRVLNDERQENCRIAYRSAARIDFRGPKIRWETYHVRRMRFNCTCRRERTREMHRRSPNRAEATALATD